MTAEIATPKLAYAAAVTGSDPNIAALAAEPAPSLEQQQQQEGSEARQENPAEKPPALTSSSTAAEGGDGAASADVADDGNAATPTPAETAEQLKKQRGNSRRGGGARGRGGGGGRGGKGASGGNRKGSWKKLDVDISFKSKKEQSSKGDNTRNDNANKEQGGRKRTDRKDRISNRSNDGNSDGKKSSGRSKHSSYGEGQTNNNGGRQRSGSGQKQQGSSSHSHGAGERSNHGKKDRSSRPNRHHHKNQQRHNRHHSRQQHYRQPQLPNLPPAELDALKADAVRQVEYFFSVNELSRNVWLRSHMDTEGYVPAAIIFNFPSVVAYSLPYQDLLAAVASMSEKVEVDDKNETIRLREGYKRWLCPNAEGGLGCPRWIKEEQKEDEGEWNERTQEPARDGKASLGVTSEDGEEDGEKVEDDAKGTNASNDESSNGSHDTPDTTPCSDSETEHTDEDQSQ